MAPEELDVTRVRACTEMSLPPELFGTAVAAAIEERGDNVFSGDEVDGVGFALAPIDAPAIAVIAKKLWKPGRTLRVRFLDQPSPRVREAIETYAGEWEKVVSLRFAFGDDPKAEIRITCTPGIGSWSYVGTDAKLIPRNKPTMNYGWFNDSTPDNEFSRTTLHEFGHAIGCIHEHQHPLGNIPWNRPTVYRYYQQTAGWNQSQVDSQIFQKYASRLLNFGRYDPLSIMHYPVPPELTFSGFSVGWNNRLSKQDKEFMAKLYPAPGAVKQRRGKK